jgi:sigma-B regulation protein RsbU (phosphoserine phosphatase)
MKKFTLFRLKNQMFFYNILANLIGILFTFVVSFRSISPPTVEILDLTLRVARFFEPLSFLFIVASTLIYERPIRHYLECQYRGKDISPSLNIKAQQRVLNEPFFLIAVDFSVWLAAALFYPMLYWSVEAGEMMIGRAFFQSLLIGLGTTTAAFFVLERVLQKKMVPHFFPDGGLHRTPRTIRIRIRTRLAGLICACNLIPFFAALAILRGSYRSPLDTVELLELLRPALVTNALFGISIGIGLAIIVSSNLTRPLQEIIRVLKGVRDGDLDNRVRVTTNDEIGYTGDVINDMTEGLRERDRMRHSLDLAREVQQNLLPTSAPKIHGLDIAGVSIYCEKTGGDYFDYLPIDEHGLGKIGVVVGDVSGHGIPSALLMTTARALIRKNATLSDNIANIISDVNQQLLLDVKDSGRFMTLFYAVIDGPNKCIRWVRAGHDPAIFYAPESDTFEELKGSGIALGVDANWPYQENEKTGLLDGQIIVLGTDGIWEARNAKSEMLGKKRIYEIIRQHAKSGANEILTAVIDTLKNHTREQTPEDDATLVIVKIAGDTS